MKQPTKNTYKTDLTLQGIVYIPMMISWVMGFIGGGFFIFAALLQFFVGVVQVSSGLYHSIKYRDKLHQNYLVIALGYLAFLYLISIVAGRFANEGLWVFLVFVIPSGIASWYYKLTWDAYKTSETDYRENKFRVPLSDYEDILDDMYF